MKLKRILVLVLVLLIALLPFTGCKKSGNEINVVGIAPSGYDGDSIRNAVTMAADEINAAGGIGKKGKKIKLFWITEGKDNVKLKNDLTQAIERDKCKYIVGGYASTAVKVAMEVMKEKKILWFGTGGAHPSIVQAVQNDPGMKYYFRVGTLDSIQQGEAIADFATAVLKPKNLLKTAYIRLNHPYSLEIIKAAQTKMEANGFKTVIKDHPVAIGATDFSDFIDKCKASGIQLIVCSFLLDETTNFIKQMGAKGMNKSIAITGAMAKILKDEFSTEIGAENAAYVTSISPQSGPVDMAGNGAAVAFAEKYKTKYNMSAYWISYSSYDALRVFKAAVEKAKSFKADKIIAAIEADDFEFQGLMNFKWKKENHDLVVGEVNNKLYAVLPVFQFFPDGSRHCVYPLKFKQKDFLMPGATPQ